MQISDMQYRGGVVLIAAIVAVLLGRIRFCQDLELPAKPDRPVAFVGTAATAEAVSESISESSVAYAEYLKDDAAAFGIQPIPPRFMGKIFPYRSERTRHVLQPGDTKEILGLSVSLSVEKVRKRSQMMLTIENKEHKPVAYRIQTKPSVTGCARLRQLKHNAIALAAGGVEKRAECGYRKGWSLAIVQVETITLPELGYLYASSVQADKLGLAKRTAGKHVPPNDAMACRILRPMSLVRAVETGKVTWRDQVDFYARHRCQTYTFPLGYKAFDKDGQEVLPAQGNP